MKKLPVPIIEEDYEGDEKVIDYDFSIPRKKRKSIFREILDWLFKPSDDKLKHDVRMREMIK